MIKKLIALILIILISSSNISISYSNKTTSQINNLVVFIDFNDTNSFNSDEAKAREVENTFNDFADDDNDKVSNTDKISLKSYIYDLTKGNTLIDTSFYPKTDTGYSSYKASQDKSYYESKTLGSTEEHNLIKDAFNSIKNEIELSPQELDKNNDGKIDSVTFVFSGVPAVSGGSMLRPHMAELTKDNPTLNGKKLSKYNIIGEGTRSINIYNKNLLGTIVHEYLHMLDYPDLYKDGGSGELVGKWDIMASSKLTPQLPTVYSRNAYGGSNLRVEEITESGVYTLKSASILNTEETVAYKIKSKEYPNEYFMIEYRKNNEKWESNLSGSGIIIYRINENVPANYGNNSDRGAHIYVFRPEDSSANSGTGNIDEAFLSQESSRTLFGTVSDSVFEFDSNSIYFADGTNSNIVISQVGSSSTDEISFKIELGTVSDEIIGDGSISNPYQIDSTNDLKQMYLTPNKHFVLTKDIDLSGVELNPIGDIDIPFSGSFDGKINTISNLTINSDKEDVGFIGRLSERGTIKNINFENINITSSGTYTGGVVGTSLGNVENVKVSGNINSSSELGVGGIVGYSDYMSKLQNSTSSVNMKTTSTRDTLVGGIIGDSYNSLVKNNYFNGTITSNEKNRVGAIYGRNLMNEENPNIDSIDNVFNITASSIENGVGRLDMPEFGENDRGTIGIELLQDINLEKGSISGDIVEYKRPLSIKNERIFSNNESIAIVNDKKVQGVSSGNTSVVYELTLGTNKIQENINVSVTGGPIINKITGSSRYSTAIKISNRGWNNSDNAVIVNSGSIVDALSATPFARSIDAPILLTQPREINNDTKKELQRLGVRNVYLIGGKATINENVEIQLKAMGIDVERISGKDRYETSLNIAKRLGEVSEIAVVNGVKGLADAVSVAPITATRNMPIILTSSNGLSSGFNDYIKSQDIKKSYVIGGVNSVSNDIKNKLPNSERISGASRNDTNAAIINKFYSDKNLNNLFVTKDGMKTEGDLIDALSVGVLAAKENSPIVLVGQNLSDKQRKSLTNKTLRELTQVGGNGNENAFSQIVDMFK